MNKIIKSKISLIKILKDLRSQNKIIVNCHGVFDILHLGHFKYLEESKSYGDILIVTVTSDEFAKNKLFEKTYFSTKERTDALSYLSVVDYIYVSDSINAVDSLRVIKPDFYLKGPDYRSVKKKDKNLLLEINEVKKYGGKFKTTKTIKYSSSNILYNRYQFLSDQQNKFIYNLKKNTVSGSILNKFEKSLSKILVIGETIIDEYIETQTIGASAKEPILVTKPIRKTDHRGGVISVGSHLKEFSKEITVITALGDSKEKNKFLKNQIDKSINFNYFEKKNSPIITKTRFLENYSKNKIFGSYNMNDSVINKSDESKFLNLIKNNIKKNDIVILLDYGHGLISKKVLKFVTKNSKFLCINKQLNSFNKNKYKLDQLIEADLFSIQESELRFHFKDQDTDILKLSKLFFNSNKLKKLVVTQGSNGSLLIDKKGSLFCPSFNNKKVIDRIGAGDTFFSFACLSSWMKIPNEFLLFIPTVAAGDKISVLGNNYSIKKTKLISLIKNFLK